MMALLIGAFPLANYVRKIKGVQRFDLWVNRVLGKLEWDFKIASKQDLQCSTFIACVIKAVACVFISKIWGIQLLSTNFHLPTETPGPLLWALAVSGLIGQQKSHGSGASPERQCTLAMALGALVVLAPLSACFAAFTYFLCAIGGQTQPIRVVSAIFVIILSYFAFYSIGIEVLIGLIGIWQVLKDYEPELDQILESN